MRGSVRKRIV